MLDSFLSGLILLSVVLCEESEDKGIESVVEVVVAELVVDWDLHFADEHVDLFLEASTLCICRGVFLT